MKNAWEVTASSKMKNNALVWLKQSNIDKKYKQKLLMSEEINATTRKSSPDSFSGRNRGQTTCLGKRKERKRAQTISQLN